MNEIIELAKVIHSVWVLPKDMCTVLAEELVRRGYHKSRWTPAADWPPESDGRYLLATDRGEILVGEWRDGMLRCACSLTTAVKWFMPAPELPKGD